MAGVSAPHHVLDLGDLDGGKGTLLLHVEQSDSVSVAQQQGACSCVEDLLTARDLDLLHNLILQVLDQQLAWTSGVKKSLGLVAKKKPSPLVTGGL